MGVFTGNIKIEQLGLTNNVKVLDDFAYYSEKYKIIVVIRNSFISDLASIPPILKSFVRASDNKYWRAFVIHDALYRYGWNRKEADLILDEALSVFNLSSYARSKIYYGLRLFGKSSKIEKEIYNAHRYVEIVDFNGFVGYVNLKNEAVDLLYGY